ncbi:class I adenylate-forming enzyme family protein [Novosphingobium colocasiae]
MVRQYRDNAILETVEGMLPELPALREVHLIEDFDDFLAGAANPAPGLPDVAPLDPCLTLFTSGTTGSPKGVMLHHKGVLNMAHMTHYRGGLRDGGVFVSPMPLFYVGGLAHAGIGAVAHRATHVVLPHWDPALYMQAVAQERGTYSLLVPTMIEAVLAHPARDTHDLSSLTCLISGASLVEEQLIRRVQNELGSSLVNVYGQTEMHGVCITTRRDDPMDKRLTTLGRPIPHFDVKIADPETGEAVALGEEGEIWVRSFQNMLGYVGQPEETARTITPDGWLRSGDLARMDEQGFVAITGRIKEMIIRGGENIYPREVETVLGDHPEIAGIAVIGIPDAFYGEQVAAVIVPREGCHPDPFALRSYARGLMMPFKVPSQWAFVDAFPFTDTGKLQKFKLREMIVAGELPVVDTATARAVARQA